MKQFLIFMCLLILSISCSKDSPLPQDTQTVITTSGNPETINDYPEAEGELALTGTFTSANWNEEYVGTYHGVWQSSSYSMGNSGPVNTKDTTLVIGPNSADSSLTTSLNNCPVIHYALSVNSFPIYHGRIDFRNDSMIYSCMNGGMGSGTNETFKGKKQ
jgi:hypothetical protein